MKLLSLEIKNVRGIRELRLTPQGKNFVIWGMNGSGKSAVVDALDFLFAEKMSRLSGSGTKGITLKAHGPHVDCSDLSNAVVTAKVQLPGLEKIVEISRTFANPETLTCSESPMPDALSSALSIAKRGQHILTRREILRFITAEGKDRAEQIQLILNITEIETVRQNLVKVNNLAKNRKKSEKSKLDQAKVDVENTSLLKNPSDSEILDFINAQRSVLGAEKLPKLEFKNLKAGVVQPALSDGKFQLNRQIALQDIGNLRKALTVPVDSDLTKIETQLVDAVNELKSDPELIRVLQRKQLIQLGIPLIDKTGDCPLCDAAWDLGALPEYLGNKLRDIDRAEKTTAEIENNAQEILRVAKEILNANSKVLEISRMLELKDHSNLLEGSTKELIELINMLSSQITDIFDINSERLCISTRLNLESLNASLLTLESALEEKLPVATPQQTAWDLLTRLEENLRVYEREQKAYDEAALVLKRANSLVAIFEQSRDTVLNELFEKIKSRFVSLYKQLHGDDEKGFDANLQPDGAGLKFEVDFYGRGHHPPHALHSEGHQDSMGVCLYLALADQLSSDILDLIVLDDVVMSVDVEHRKQLCEVLKDNFPKRQFLITTHDKTWAEMLKKSSVVGKNGLKEFFNWTVDNGPTVNEHEDVWGKIEFDLSRSDVSAAAAKLRRAAEQTFYEICGALRAKIIFKPGGQWDLGDLSSAGISCFKERLKQAKEAANSWGNAGAMAEISSLESEFKISHALFENEKWTVNPLVHFSDWAEFSPDEFRDVVNAFRDLFNVMSCQRSANCGSEFYITLVGLAPDSLRCRCGAINWPLNKK